MKQKFVELYIDWAKRVSKLSYARRLQVGAVIVKDNCVISYGYNGTPSGWDNECEVEIYPNELLGDFELNCNEFDAMFPYVDENGKRYRLKTKPEVLHAESNALMKLAKGSNSGLNADLFITHSPCLECAKLIYQAGISRVWYETDYRDDAGIQFLRTLKVEVTKI